MTGNGKKAMGQCKKRPRWLLPTGTFFALLICIASVSQAKVVIRLANGEWPPFTSKRLKCNGVYSHIVAEAFALEGIAVEYNFFPWPRSYAYTRNGDRDGSLTWAKTPEKEKEVFFSDPVFFHTKVFFHLKSFAFDWNALADLKRFTIGTTAEYTYGTEFFQAVQNGAITIEPVTSDIQNLKKLLAGRIHLFPSDIDVANYLLNDTFTPEEAARITHHDKPIQKTWTCVILSKTAPEKNKRLLSQFNRGLRKLKENGSYAQMIEAFRQGAYKRKPLTIRLQD
jgi:polar amino acid transport system substrate-binding protein